MSSSRDARGLDSQAKGLPHSSSHNPSLAKPGSQRPLVRRGIWGYREGPIWGASHLVYRIVVTR